MTQESSFPRPRTMVLTLVGLYGAGFATDALLRSWPPSLPPGLSDTLAFLVLAGSIALLLSLLLSHIRRAERSRASITRGIFRSVLQVVGSLLGLTLGAFAGGFATLAISSGASDVQRLPIGFLIAPAVIVGAMVVSTWLHWWLGGHIGSKLDRMRERRDAALPVDATDDPSRPPDHG